jgi:porphobilinogen deaminase
MRPLTNLSKFSAVGTSSWGRRTGTPFQSPRGLVQRRKQGEQVVEERVRELADAVVLATAALRRRGIILRLLHSVEQVAYHSGRGRSACAGARRGKERLSDGGDQEDGWRKRVESKRGI